MYNLLYERNIGIIKKEDQKKIKKKKILISGCGGMGGVCAESLIRMGFTNLTLVDHDLFEFSNSNRQVFSNIKNVGKNKANTLKKELKKINPLAKIKVYKEALSKDNIDKIFEKKFDIVVNGMDEFLPSLILERKAREKKITIVDAWLTPFASVFVMTPNSPHWEDFLNLPTKGKEINEITEDDLKNNLIIETNFTLSQFNTFDIITKELVQGVLDKKIKRPSFLPVVWLSGILMANEVFKITCDLPHVDHLGIFFNQYDMKIQKGMIK